MSRIVVLQPYVPEYREPFFELVADRLTQSDHELVVVSGQPTDRDAARGDVSPAATPWHLVVATRRFRLGPVGLTRLDATDLVHDADALVVELRPGSLDALFALADRDRRIRRRIAVWGHVGDFVRPPGVLRTRIKRWMVRRADVVFAYTAAGRDLAIRWGAPEPTVHSLDNTIATDGLALAAPADRSPDPKTFAYLGSLDAPKRIDFLRQALDDLDRGDPAVRLLVAGEGSESSLLDDAVARGQVVKIGRAGTDGKRLLGEKAVAILNPGRVGLVAVDSFALGLPIVTTDWRHHSVEFAYLSPGLDSVVTPDDPAAFADGVLELLADPDRLAALREGAWRNRGWPSLEHMADTFVDGCLQLLGERRR